MSKLYLPLLLITALPLVTIAQPAKESVKTGPAIGSVVPDFQTTDQNGRSQTLRSILGPKGALLVFFRSADW